MAAIAHYEGKADLSMKVVKDDLYGQKLTKNRAMGILQSSETEMKG